ncbi:MAG: PilN domain-containing protein [Chromatiales bacterium]|jgi:general secretion pathway protein L
MASPIGTDSLFGRRIPQFFDWWLGELADMLPESLRGVLRPEKRRLLVVIEEDQARFAMVGPGGRRELGSLTLTGDSEEARRVDALLGKDRLGVEDIVLCLPAAAVMQKTLSLPLAAQENLREVLSFEMDRYTPFRADAVYYDYRVQARDPQAGRLRVWLGVVPRARLDPLLESLAAMGLQPGIVDVALEEPEAESPELNLLPVERRRRGPRSAKVLNRVLASLVALLVIAALAIPLVQRHALVDSLRQELAVARAEAEEARRLREQLDRSTAEGAFLVQRKREELPLVQVLDELTRLLPDDTWLYGFEAKDSTVELKGESSEAAMLVSAIENAPFFSNTRFAAAITKNPQSGDDRFVLSTSIANQGDQ